MRVVLTGVGADPWYWFGWVIVGCLAVLFVSVTVWIIIGIVRAIREPAGKVIESAPTPDDDGPKLRSIGKAS